MIYIYTWEKEEKKSPKFYVYPSPQSLICTLVPLAVHSRPMLYTTRPLLQAINSPMFLGKPNVLSVCRSCAASTGRTMLFYSKIPFLPVQLCLKYELWILNAVTKYFLPKLAETMVIQHTPPNRASIPCKVNPNIGMHIKRWQNFTRHSLSILKIILEVLLSSKIS